MEIVSDLQNVWLRLKCEILFNSKQLYGVNFDMGEQRTKNSFENPDDSFHHIQCERTNLNLSDGCLTGCQFSYSNYYLL